MNNSSTSLRYGFKNDTDFDVTVKQAGNELFTLKANTYHEPVEIDWVDGSIEINQIGEFGVHCGIEIIKEEMSLLLQVSGSCLENANEIRSLLFFSYPKEEELPNGYFYILAPQQQAHLEIIGELETDGGGPY